MIWTYILEAFPHDGYLHPHYDGKGWDGRHYRPLWHAAQALDADQEVADAE